MLSDRTIKGQMNKGNLLIFAPDGTPLLPSQIQPVSVDLRLGAVSLRDGTEFPCDAHFTKAGSEKGSHTWIIEPQQFLLGATWEWVDLSENLVGTVAGKSTIAREGLIIEAAGLVDPGFGGRLTLEMFNMSDEPIRLVQHQLICQISFQWTDITPERIYNKRDNHYQGQSDPTPSWRLAS